MWRIHEGDMQSGVQGCKPAWGDWQSEGYAHLQYVQVGARDERVGGLILHIGARVGRLEGGTSVRVMSDKSQGAGGRREQSAPSAGHKCMATSSTVLQDCLPTCPRLPPERERAAHQLSHHARRGTIRPLPAPPAAPHQPSNKDPHLSPLPAPANKRAACRHRHGDDREVAVLLQESPVLPHDQVVKCILCRGGGGRGGVGEDANGQASVRVQSVRGCVGDNSSQRDSREVMVLLRVRSVGYGLPAPWCILP